MPFAEGALIYLLQHYAYDFAINLEIVDVKWSEIGSALLTGKIDVAVYTDVIKDQIKASRWLLDNRQIYSSEAVFCYNGYFILHPNTAPNPLPNPLKVAVASHSDHHEALQTWMRSPNKYVVEQIPVDTPDDALALFLDKEGDCNACFCGHLHKYFAEKITPGALSKIDIGENKDEAVGIKMWTVARTRSEAEDRLEKVVSVWNRVKDEWDRIKHGVGSGLEDLRKDCVAHVNRQPNRVFVHEGSDEEDFKKLCKLIDDHNELKAPDAGGITESDV